MAHPNLPTNTTCIGNAAEEDACAFLKTQGLKLVEKNFTVTNEAGKKTGEIDLIMHDKEFLVFIEVKKRKKEDYGNVLEMITPQKRSRIIRTATSYLVRNHQFHNTCCRFDVIGITPREKNLNAQKIIWIKDAFQVQY